MDVERSAAVKAWPGHQDVPREGQETWVKHRCGGKQVQGGGDWACQESCTRCRQVQLCSRPSNPLVEQCAHAGKACLCIVPLLASLR